MTEPYTWTFPKPEGITFTTDRGLVIPIELRYLGQLPQCDIHTLPCRAYDPVIEGNLEVFMPDVIKFDALSWPDGSHLRIAPEGRPLPVWLNQAWVDRMLANSPALQSFCRNNVTHTRSPHSQGLTPGLFES